MGQPKLDIRFLVGGLPEPKGFYKKANKAISVIPAQAKERIINDCVFIVIGEHMLGAYVPNIGIEGKHLIIFPETLIENEQWAFIMLHEIAHFICGHEKISVTNKESLLESFDQEESANALALRWSNEIERG